MAIRKTLILSMLPGLQVLVNALPSAVNSTGEFWPLNITAYWNNQGFGSSPGEASLGVLNESYPAVDIGTDGIFTSPAGIEYYAPGYQGPLKADNVICEGQTIDVEPGEYFSVSILHSSDVREATVSAGVTFTYADNSTSTTEIRSEPWWAFLTINRGEIIYPFLYTANSTNYNTSHIFELTASLTPGKALTSITLPSTTNVTTGRIHVFGISLWKGSGGVEVQSVRPTQKWIGNETQIVEVTINHSGDECVHGEGLNVTLSGSGIKTVVEGNIKRLCPGDQKRVLVGVLGSSNSSLTVTLKQGAKKTSRTFADVVVGLSPWTTDLSNLERHETPEWFDGAKYGIFIHWGPYSVPGWGNSTPYESYAEWFWWYSTHRAADRSDFYNYRLNTFGPEWNYDDSFPEFTASAYDPKEWVDLIADAGAKYFVITSKHHDGFAIFDTADTSNRSSIHYGPQRDLLKELFDAAAQYQPSLYRGTYFSLPEWFNPDYGKYGFSQFDRNSSTTWPGIIARNPYTGLEEPYTGRTPINDYIDDLQVPQMDILAYEYQVDIMWCDTGAANGSAEFAARWFNHARSQNRQVAINSRCGLAHVNDFDTPEYETFATPQRRKWESNQGMDPYSYGYNRATPDSAYMNASTIVAILVDMVSKNGNLLLDIGPRADGSIVQAEIDNLREAGKWIHANGEAIFNTTYWFVQAEETDASGEKNVRFTQTNDAFFILSLEKPINGRLEIEAAVPILDGDRVTLMGAGNATDHLAWKKSPSGGLTIEVPSSALDQVEHCWVFKVEYLA